MNTKTKAGRPKAKTGTALSKVVTFKVTDSEKALYDVIAEMQNISISELVRKTMNSSHRNAVNKIEQLVGNLKELGIKVK